MQIKIVQGKKVQTTESKISEKNDLGKERRSEKQTGNRNETQMLIGSQSRKCVKESKHEEYCCTEAPVFLTQ